MFVILERIFTFQLLNVIRIMLDRFNFLFGLFYNSDNLLAGTLFKWQSLDTPAAV